MDTVSDLLTIPGEAVHIDYEFREWIFILEISSIVQNRVTIKVGECISLRISKLSNGLLVSELVKINAEQCEYKINGNTLLSFIDLLCEELNIQYCTNSPLESLLILILIVH